MTDNRVSDLSAPMLAAGETIAPSQNASTHDRLDDLAPHRAFGPGRPGNLVVRPEAPTSSGALLRREAAGTQQLGMRLLAQVESQDLLFGELRQTIAAIERQAATGEQTELIGLARTAQEVLSWCDAVLLELEAEGNRAASGAQAIDLLDLVQDTLHDLTRDGRQRVTYVGGHANCAVWASVPALGLVVRLALELMETRVGGSGGIHIEVGDDATGHFVRVEGIGEITGEPTAERLVEFREAVDAAGMRVVPDERSKGRSGLELRFTDAARGPLLDHAS